MEVATDGEVSFPWLWGRLEISQQKSRCPWERVEGKGSGRAAQCTPNHQNLPSAFPAWCKEQDSSQGGFHDKPRHSTCCCNHSTTPALPPSSHGTDLHHIPLPITAAAQVGLPEPRNIPLPQEERELIPNNPIFRSHHTQRSDSVVSKRHI